MEEVSGPVEPVWVKLPWLLDALSAKELAEDTAKSRLAQDRRYGCNLDADPHAADDVCDHILDEALDLL